MNFNQIINKYRFEAYSERQIDRITNLINRDLKHKKVFEEFLIGLQKNINPSISDQQAIEMLSQHIITKPVFEALFEGYSFVQNNAISISMQKMLSLLEEGAIEKDTQVLQNFYDSVKKRASGIDNAEGKQRIIIELYDKFFKTAFPKMVEQLGIVYTPVEIVDFIIHSVNDVLKKEFGRTISDENVHVLDPFTGTGTFITRLLQSGLIKTKDLKRKYESELHANEIVLLAYYIAAVNIENTYHDLLKGKNEYKSFDGICLTDTFQLGETDESEKYFSTLFPKNSERVQKQKNTPLMVIIGNPPYSIGQKSENDNAKNQEYKKLDNKISLTYVANSNSTMNKSLYDAYIKAFRWSSDRLEKENGGIICFVSNGSWLDGNATSGFRKCIEKEFSNIYVFNTRGNARTQGELRRKEAGNVFGSGSRTPISITLLVKNPKSKIEKASIKYYDIGDYLNREEKLEILKQFSTITSQKIKWDIIKSNNFGDWINQRNNIFYSFIKIGSKKNIRELFFNINSNGVITSRDAWVYNFSSIKVFENVNNMILFYNEQLEGFNKKSKIELDIKVKDYINTDSKKISWSRALKQALNCCKIIEFNKKSIVIGIYRPFMKQSLYFNRDFNECVYQFPAIKPNSNCKNLIIIITSVAASKEFSTLITDVIPNYHTLDTDQCFPLYYYKKNEEKQQCLFNTFEKGNNNYIRKDGISDFIFLKAKEIYNDELTKEDIFYYVYGILHSPEYRITFKNDLKKMLPRIPLVNEQDDFWSFSKAGRELADLHINYEKVPPYPDVIITGNDCGYYMVEKMRFPKKDGLINGKKKRINDKSTIIYNSKIIIKNIPDKAYEYIVNGKSAIEWIMDRYQVTVDKKSGIKNDPNDWSKEVGNPRYIIDLLLSIINVSVQTVDIVNDLPRLEFDM